MCVSIHIGRGELLAVGITQLYVRLALLCEQANWVKREAATFCCRYLSQLSQPAPLGLAVGRSCAGELPRLIRYVSCLTCCTLCRLP